MLLMMLERVATKICTLLFSSSWDPVPYVYFFVRGLHPVPDKEVIAMYEGSHVPLEIMSDFYGKVSYCLRVCVG